MLCMRIRVTGTFRTSESTKTRLLNKRLKKIFCAGGYAPSPDPASVGRGTPLPASLPHSAPSAPRGPPQIKCLDPPLTCDVIHSNVGNFLDTQSYVGLYNLLLAEQLNSTVFIRKLIAICWYVLIGFYWLQLHLGCWVDIAVWQLDCEVGWAFLRVHACHCQHSFALL